MVLAYTHAAYGQAPEAPAERTGTDAQLDEAESYCEHVREASHSEALRLRSPWVAFRGSTLQSSELSTNLRQDLIYRGRAGLGLSITDWVRASLVEQLGEAECEFRRAQVKMRPASGWNSEVLLLEGYQAKVEALESSKDQAEMVLDKSRRALERNDRTIAQHLRTLSAFQNLGTELAETRAKVTELSRDDAPRTDLDPRRKDELRRTAGQVGSAQGRLRRSEAFLLTLEGGYDEILDIDQNVPVYAQVNAVFRPLWFFQGGPEKRSAAALARATVAQATAAVDTLLDQRPLMRTELTRFREWAETLKAEQARVLDAKSADGSFLAEQIWFQGELASAEAIRLETSLRVLDEFAAP